jgi:hypothetical protein
VVNGVLLKPLAYHEPERIVTLLHDGRRPVAPADYLDWRAQSQSFESMAAAEAWGGVLADSERPESIVGLRLGEGLFQLLGVAPALGRTFDAQDFRLGQDQVVVLSHSLWERRFGGDKAVVGGVTIARGDVVVADCDGIVVIPADRVEAVAEAVLRDGSTWRLR